VTRTTRRRIATALLVPAFALTAAACGDDDGGGSSRDAFVAALADEIGADGTVSGDQAECIAGEIVDAVGVDRLTEAGLTPDAVEADPPAELEAEVAEATFAAIAECGIDISQLSE
jgi:hypothetical protein